MENVKLSLHSRTFFGHDKDKEHGIPTQVKSVILFGSYGPAAAEERSPGSS